MHYWPIIKVYYNEYGHLIIVYAAAWAKSFQSGSDFEGLETIANGKQDGD